jgi:uncharacterized membrane protein YoaK (UPF0700 family)
MNRARFILGLLLTATAGAINAVSFTRFGAVYASFMSGNTVQIGLLAGGRDWAGFGYFGALVALFMFGGFAGGLVLGKAPRWAVAIILVLNGALLGAALWLDLRYGLALASTAPLSLAMGLQNHLVVLVRGANPGTTFVTGTAFRFGDAVAQAALGRDPHHAWRLHLAVWLSFAVGAALGLLAHLRLSRFALAPVTGLVASCALVAVAATLLGQVRERRVAAKAARSHASLDSASL